MSDLNWSISSIDRQLISNIVERAMELSGLKTGKINIIMNLIVVHANGCPLDLEQLLQAKDGDLLHDVSGIGFHLNHNTGQLNDFFLPRFAK